MRLRKAFFQAPDREKEALKEIWDNLRAHVKPLHRAGCHRRDRRRREKGRAKFTKNPQVPVRASGSQKIRRTKGFKGRGGGAPP